MRFSSLGVMVIYSRREIEGETMSGEKPKQTQRVCMCVCVCPVSRRVTS